MPLLADTIVECGRRTLSNAISLATKWGSDKSSKYFGAEVVYGDTDSIFIKLPGRSVKEAFDFGKKFTDAVTASNPPPVQLKLEKVYSGSLLQTVSMRLIYAINGIAPLPFIHLTGCIQSSMRHKRKRSIVV